MPLPLTSRRISDRGCVMGRRFVSSLCSVVLVVLCAPGVACAFPGLARPVTGSAILGFGVSYSSAGKQCTHRGLDLSAEAGARVLAAASGVVSFSGGVPADGGGRTNAVTIKTASGLLVSVMPLDRALVRTGDAVSEGDCLGMLAESGDGSSAGAHVHLSVREGDTYIDPETLLAGLPNASVPGIAQGASSGSADEGPESSSGAGERPVVAQSGQLAASQLANGRAAHVDAPPTLSPEQAASLEQALAAQIERMHAGRGRLRGTGFAEPSFADVLRGAAIEAGRLTPPVSAGTGLISAAAIGLLLARRLRDAPVLARASSREE